MPNPGPETETFKRQIYLPGLEIIEDTIPTILLEILNERNEYLAVCLWLCGLLLLSLLLVLLPSAMRDQLIIYTMY